MIIIIDAFGNIQSSVPESSIFRGSNNANRITVLAPLSASTQFILACQIPNGEYLPEQIMTRVDSNNEDYNIWTIGINKAMTDLSGKLLLQFKAVGETSVITSFECSFEVQKGVISAEDKELLPLSEQILSAIANLNGDIADINNKKQDKTDIGITTNDWQDSQQVVGAINNNTEKNTINSSNIDINTNAIAKNTQDIEDIKQQIGTGENYIGQMGGETLPTEQQLNNFVRLNTSPSRVPQGGDVIIFILLLEDTTDEIYKYTYNGKVWNSYLIPNVEEAKNGSLGIIEGTYGIGDTNDTLVDIAGGKILNIYVKRNGEYRNIVEFLGTNENSISKIINGTTQVGNALKAVQDALGNVIDTTYLTKTNGLTKKEMYDYALPRTFNDPYYYTKDGFGKTPPTQETGFQGLSIIESKDTLTSLISPTINDVGSFELSNRNSFHYNVWVNPMSDIAESYNVTLKFYLYVWKVANGGSKKSLAVVESSPIQMITGQFYNVEFNSLMNQIGDSEIVTVTESDDIQFELWGTWIKGDIGEFKALNLDFYSNDVYPMVANLNIQSAIFKIQDGLIGELPTAVLELEKTQSAGNIGFVVNSELLNNTLTEFYGNFTLSEGVSDTDTVTLTDKTGEEFKIITPYNFGTTTLPTIKDFNQAMLRTDATTNITSIRFEGFVVRGENGANYIYLDIDNLTDAKTELVTALKNGDIIPKEAEIASDYKEGGTIATTLKAHNETLTKLIKGDYIGAGDNIELTKSDSGTIIAVTGVILELTNAEMIEALTGGGYKVGQLVVPKDDDGYVKGHIYQFEQNNNVYDWADVTPKATMTGAGIIRIATDSEVDTGTAEDLAINPKQLKTAIDGLGTVFTLKGAVDTVADLPATGNNIGDVWYVKSESVGYVWLDDNGTLRWEQLGATIDASTLVDLTSTQTITGDKTFDGKTLIKNLTLNIERPWTFEQSNTGANATLDLKSEFDGKAFRITSPLKTKGISIAQSETGEHNWIAPIADNVTDLGRNSYQWRNLYIKGNISDGTNSVNVGSIVTKNNKKYVNYDNYFAVNTAGKYGKLFVSDKLTQSWDSITLIFEISDKNGVNNTRGVARYSITYRGNGTNAPGLKVTRLFGDANYDSVLFINYVSTPYVDANSNYFELYYLGTYTGDDTRKFQVISYARRSSEEIGYTLNKGNLENLNEITSIGTVSNFTDIVYVYYCTKNQPATITSEWKFETDTAKFKVGTDVYRIPLTAPAGSSTEKRYILGTSAYNHPATMYNPNVYQQDNHIYSNASQVVNLADEQTITGIKNFDNAKFKVSEGAYSELSTVAKTGAYSDLSGIPIVALSYDGTTLNLTLPSTTTETTTEV